MINQDSKRNDYIETDVSKIGRDESIRVTLVEEGYTGEPCLRIQIRKHEGGRVYMGPEIPVEYAQNIIQSIRTLTNQEFR
ncbi:hypothetical protein [Peribacillus simplex]|uniref:Uncharacterized protein n=1 Tax=Peribacillus simplex TaxID=1478 RepID=A0A9W4KX23_9BACI|nr:hypothetical protein [Peribacillus simplex]CAH0169678.1 hypothetical protein SRABI133_01153 [Peribacillus simplex]